MKSHIERRITFLEKRIYLKNGYVNFEAIQSIKSVRILKNILNKPVLKLNDADKTMLKVFFNHGRFYNLK